MPIDVNTYTTRFWASCTKTRDCWIWTKSIRADGYANTRLGDLYGGHRVAYFLHYGIHPGDRLVCHKCDNPACINPAHLFLGSAYDNNIDKIRKNRHNPCLGENNASTKLTSDQIHQIRNEYIPRQVTLKAIAEKYGVSEQTIHNIIKGATWSHV